jgi:hypothetical protein
VTFKKNISPPSSELKSKQTRSRTWLLAVSCCFLSYLTIRPWRWKQYVSPKHRLTFTGLNNVISKKTEIFINAGVKKSVTLAGNPKKFVSQVTAPSYNDFLYNSTWLQEVMKRR